MNKNNETDCIEALRCRLDSLRQELRERIYSKCSHGGEIRKDENGAEYYSLHTELAYPLVRFDIEIMAYIGEGWLYFNYGEYGDEPVDFDDMYTDDLIIFVEQ